MSNSNLPERASLEYLRKLAKERLRELRQTDAHAKLAQAQLLVAREHGLSSWRALKAEVEARQQQNVRAFFDACGAGDVAAVEALCARDPDLVRERTERLSSTGLHLAADHGHLSVVDWLLSHGADPNARDVGDNAYPVHFAAGNGHVEVVRALLAAGTDVHGIGDVHESDVIGWASTLERYDLLDLLIDLGADLEAEDGTGHTALATAVFRGDREAVNRLRAAGAKEPPPHRSERHAQRPGRRRDPGLVRVHRLHGDGTERR